MKLTGKKENFNKFLAKVDELGYAINDLLPINWPLTLTDSTRLLNEMLSDKHLKVKQETVTASDNVAIQIKTILQDVNLQVSTSLDMTLDSNNRVEYILNWWQWQISCQLALIAQVSEVYENTKEATS
ncbi:hypothetical protein L2721_09145 [Lactobacillus crispatus]|uniref:hypothetical protein n=1 Tax=Lactobacillus crispatus TaxID=47770 RepID=UPI001E293386|nr:hypothetical protein [Lactobacillus crispatus]MCZ3675782.1 hypothetical protein [Lactobacillus crispatus]MCZ3683359.1 hypothetical protein [Lactobacillus crispatus]